MIRKTWSKLKSKRSAYRKAQVLVFQAAVLVIFMLMLKGRWSIPGVYKIGADSRVGDVLTLTGGLLKNADTSQINFAHKLADQMVIYIPKAGESSPITNTVGVAEQAPNTTADTASNTTTQTSTSQNAADSGKINLNTATKEQLTQLTGIGDKKADLIIAYRQEHGNFKSIDELKNISGIGDKTFEAISAQLTV